MHDSEPPNSVKDVRFFLGFANYYRRFVFGYASIASPLTLLTKKNIEWHWGLVQCRTFSELKSALCSVPLLIFLDPKLLYTVVIDASADAVGGVSKQDQGDGLRHLVFMSRALNSLQNRGTGLWEGASGSHIMLHPVATLFGGLSKRDHGGNR